MSNNKLINLSQFILVINWRETLRTELFGERITKIRL